MKSSDLDYVDCMNTMLRHSAFFVLCSGSLEFSFTYTHSFLLQVRYHLDEDPKTLKVFQIPLKDAKVSSLHYDRMSLSPDGKILATTRGSTLQWLCYETGEILDTAEKSHEGL